jgi:hypothetical protein
MLSTARSRGTSNSSTGPRKCNDLAVTVNIGVESDNEMMPLSGPISLVDVVRGDKFTSVEDDSDGDDGCGNRGR